ncbi:MAG: LysM peptidoglycan-binding domain-containing protein [Dehalococcoidia bacterium]|nr:LysM peptidoglycan-binding domain-containing protein [Dehalococcoidia bacterium]
MKVFRLRREPESGEEEKEFILDTDAEAQAPAQDTPAAEGGPSQEDDSLDPDLLDIFHAAKNEVEESTPASELADIPVHDLLSDLVGVSHRLHATPRAHAEPGCDEARDLVAEPSEEVDAAEADGSECPQATAPPRTGYRRYTLHSLTLGLALAAAIGGLMGAGRPARMEPFQDLPAQSQAGYLKSPLLLATAPGIAMTSDGQAGATPEATPSATPEPRPELQPAYFLYTVHAGDTVYSIAQTFGISPDYVLWNNPKALKDPNLLVADEVFLIPSVNGIIYPVKPGDTLSDIAARYHIDVQRIVSFAPNGLTSPTNHIAGMILILPGAVPPLPVEAPAPAVPHPTKTPQATETPQPTETPQATETPQPTETPQATETPQPTETPQATETPQPTETPLPTDTPQATETPQPIETPQPADTPQVTETPQPADTPQAIETPQPTETPQAEPSP